jgi:hypothetical protein
MSRTFLGLVYALENSDNDKYIVGYKYRFPVSLHEDESGYGIRMSYLLVMGHSGFLEPIKL